MSTSINIVPTITTDITFGDVLSLASKYFHEYLHSVGINVTLPLEIWIITSGTPGYRVAVGTDKFAWAENEYAALAIDKRAGAICIEYLTLYNAFDTDYAEDKDPWWFIDEVKYQNKLVENIDEKLEKAKLLNCFWSLDSGKSWTMNLCYGCLARALAELTGGIIEADSVWEEGRFPAESKDMVDWMRPDKALTEEYRDWLSDVAKELQEEIDDYFNSLEQ